MSNAMTVFQEGGDLELADAFKEAVSSGLIAGGDLGEGIGGSYAILSIRGKTFRVKHQGEETPITDDKGDAVGSLEAVIVKANPYLTKQYYEKAFEDGDAEAPSCFSIDGKVPSPSVEVPQHTNCAMCPMNKFGSRVTPAGVKVKACQDNKKLAITSLADIEGKAIGGAMLFRVPASALKDLLAFNNLMTARGYPYNAVAVRIGFDIDASYPKPTFRAIRPLRPDEAERVIAMYQSDQVDRLLADFSDINAKSDAAPAEPAADDAFEQPQPSPKPVAKVTPPPPVAKPTLVKTAAPATPKAPASTVTKPAAAAKPAPKAATPPPPVAKPKAVPLVAPPVEEAAPEAAEETADAGGDLSDDIAAILGELNATAA